MNALSLAVLALGALGCLGSPTKPAALSSSLASTCAEACQKANTATNVQERKALCAVYSELAKQLPKELGEASESCTACAFPTCQAPAPKTHTQDWQMDGFFKMNDDDGASFYGWGLDKPPDTTKFYGLRACKTEEECGSNAFALKNFQDQGSGILPVSEKKTQISARGFKSFTNGNKIGLRYYEESFCFAANEEDESKLPSKLTPISATVSDKCAFAGKLDAGALVWRCRAATWTKCLSSSNATCSTKGVGKCFVPFAAPHKWASSNGDNWNDPEVLVHRPGCSDADVSYSVNTPDVCGEGYTEVPCDKDRLKCHMSRGALEPGYKSKDEYVASTEGAVMNEILGRAAEIAYAMGAHCETMTKVLG